MIYSIELRDRIYVKGFGFLSFAKNIRKSLSNKYGEKLLDSAKNSKEQFKKQQKQLVIWLVIKIADEITGILKKPAKELLNNNDETKDVSHKKRYIYLQKKDNKLLMN